MDVFLIPVAADRYELYCELPDDDPGDPPEGRGWFRNLWHRFRQALAEAERARQQPPSEPPAVERSWYNRIKGLTLRRIAESVAEQRLLWHMRGRESAMAIHPADVAAEEALRVVRASMRSDFEKHRYWVVIDAVLFILAGLLTILPGPNVIAYYVGFRLVGHYLSMRGARQALDSVQWTTSASTPLAELRRAITLDPDAREARVSAIASELQLERLASFFRRTAVPSA
jgi:hypothetical protein